ncbi:MAG: quinolinate synthase NadA [Dictyoglomi bacterium]|nr:quinolinate synthase NadA [Dictyoglomota bacterium]
MSIKEEILKLKKEKDIVIVAHNYQPPIVQDVADFLGDSLALARQITQIPQKKIIFAGVRFMAETAKILAPEKTILHPVPSAGCGMAWMIEPEDVRRLKAQHPDALVACYINTTAAVKAECDVVVTSASALKIIEKVDTKKIIFLPDKNLGRWVANHFPDKEFIFYDGFCYVHNYLKPEDILDVKKEHPEAHVMVHAETPPEVWEYADIVTSTSGMIRYVEEHPEVKEFIVGTEVGMIYRLKTLFPDKDFYAVKRPMVCRNMKAITAEDILRSLKEETYPVHVPEHIAQRARAGIEKMLELTR